MNFKNVFNSGILKYEITLCHLIKNMTSLKIMRGIFLIYIIQIVFYCLLFPKFRIYLLPLFKNSYTAI